MTGIYTWQTSIKCPAPVRSGYRRGDFVLYDAPAPSTLACQEISLVPALRKQTLVELSKNEMFIGLFDNRSLTGDEFMIAIFGRRKDDNCS
ncbi:hypothetical protein [Mesorhizobium sp. WSM3626]|uniref:hypothetical protein n=1 Tax=Mesorhizobium sp. WSM3626 TaxID=1040987 RepID=UPI0012EC523C|nr:hypothetical protein [Mesorhizobium sp. WSM3626]